MNQINTANEFSLFIETLANEKNLSKMEAILDYCAENFIDPVEVVPHISKSLRDKIEYELQQEGRLPKSTTMTL
jgi:hypothetical protein